MGSDPGELGVRLRTVRRGLGLLLVLSLLAALVPTLSHLGPDGHPLAHTAEAHHASPGAHQADTGHPDTPANAETDPETESDHHSDEDSHQHDLEYEVVAARAVETPSALEAGTVTAVPASSVLPLRAGAQSRPD